MANPLSRANLAAALRPPKNAPKSPPKPPTMAEGFVQPSAHEQLVEYLARDADHRKWFHAMVAADSGNTSRMIDVFSDALDRDGRLRGLATKRVISMMGRPIVFRPQDGLEGDEEAQRAARMVHRILLIESRDFRSKLQHLMSGAINGYAVAKKQWARNASGEWVPHLVDRDCHANRFGYDRETLQIGFYKGGYKGSLLVEPLANFSDSFIWHEPMAGRADYPWRRGAMRSCIVPSFVKRNGLRYWLTLAERFGVPQVYAKVPAGTDFDDQSTTSVIGVVKTALASLSRYWYAVFGDDITLEKIEGSGEADAEVHKLLVEWANTEMAIALLGQNLTTEVQGGSRAASETHRWVADDIHIADAVELAQTITQQLCEPIVRFNMPGAPIPICEINTGRKQVIKTEHVVQGVFSPNEMRNSMGHPAKAEGEGGDEYRDPPTNDRGVVEGAPTGPRPDDPSDDGNDLDGDGDSRTDDDE